MHFDGAWGDEYGRALLRTLAAQPADFLGRLVIATIEEPWEMAWIGEFGRLFPRGRPRPSVVKVPYTVLGATMVEPTRERSRRPFVTSFLGRSYASFDGGRLKLLEQIVAAGGLCDRAGWREPEGPAVACVLCAPGTSRAAWRPPAQRDGVGLRGERRAGAMRGEELCAGGALDILP
mmetsp:Transcript_29497/g.76316  ORF Transcript_29497/g.76316 Transcript_29497/m.76316 type:complete len:177 (-) Transcript_29497:100-630(-)